MKAADIIDRFATGSAAGKEIVGPALGISPKAVEQWERREQVPGRWHLALLRLARDRGVALTEDELLSTINRTRGGAERVAI